MKTKVNCEDHHCLNNMVGHICILGVLNIKLDGPNCVCESRLHVDDVSSCTDDGCEHNQSYMCALPAEERSKYIIHGRCTMSSR